MATLLSTTPPGGVVPSNVSTPQDLGNVDVVVCDGYNTTNVTCDYDQGSLYFEFVVSIIVPIIFGSIVICGFIGNLLVIIVVVCNKQMRNTTNLLIINLAVADLFFIIICVPFTGMSYAMHWWPLGSVFCKIYQYAINVTAYASVYTLVLMSLDRYLAVVHPISSMTKRTERNAYIIIVISWAVICSVNIPVVFEYDVVGYQHNGENRSACIPLNIYHYEALGQIFYGCFFAFAYVLPLTLVCILYGLMLKRLLYGVVPGGNQSAESMRSKRRVTRMVVIVVLIFALCWLPLQIIFMVQYFGTYPDTVAFLAIQIASNCLMYTNSCVNPFLYAFLSDNFRKSFMKLLCCTTRFHQRMKLEVEKTTARGLEPVTRNYTPNTMNNTEYCV